MNLESSKYLGGIGALLIVVGLAGAFGAYLGILTLVGIVLVLVAVHGLAGHYKERGIFNNMLYAIILLIVGVVAFAVVIVVGAIAAFESLGVEFSGRDWTVFERMFEQGIPMGDVGALLTFIGAAIIALVVLFIFAILAAVFFRKSLSMIASRTGVRMFGTAGMLMLVGAILTIILVGFVVMWVAWILVAVAFFLIRT